MKSWTVYYLDDREGESRHMVVKADSADEAVDQAAFEDYYFGKFLGVEENGVYN